MHCLSGPTLRALTTDGTFAAELAAVNSTCPGNSSGLPHFPLDVKTAIQDQAGGGS